jgi:phosphatidylglycerol:prolipoprotein diacylglycerol transferase
VVIVLILAQSIGRWGNYFNQELYGLSTGNFHMFPFTVLIGGSPHLALFFYESILNLVGFILLFIVFSKQKNWGTTSAVYLIVYGTIRGSLELLRDPYYILGNNIAVSMVISIVAIGLGILLLILGKLGKISQKDMALRCTKEKQKK